MVEPYGACVAPTQPIDLIWMADLVNEQNKIIPERCYAAEHPEKSAVGVRTLSS